MGTFKDLYDKQFEVHTESMVEEIHTEGIIDNIVDWIKGEKLVALSRFKYLNQFCKSFEDKEINKGLWKLFMPPSENYVAKLGMYALGRTPGQILKGYIKNIIKGLTPKKEKPEEAGRYYPDTSTNNEKEEEPVKTPDEILQDFQSFADIIDRNAATMDMQPTPVELEKCNYIVKVLHKLQGVKKQDWTDVLEESKEDMKNSPKFFDFKEQLKPLEHMVDKMEEFRYKWSKFILDNVKFEEVKTRGDDAGSRREVPKPASDEPSESSTQPETSTTEENVATENFVINTESYNTINLFKDLGEKKNYNINTESWYDTAGYKTKRLLNKVYYKDIEIRVYSKTYQPNDAMRTIWHYGFSNKQKNIPSTETKEQEQYYKEKIIDYCNKNFKLPSGHEEYAEYILDYTGKNLDEAMNMKASPYDFNGEMRKIYFILQGVLKNNSHKLIIDFIKKNFTAGWYDKDGKLLKKIL